MTGKLSHIANKLRSDSLRMTTTAGSGHPTTCLSMAEILSVLFFHEMHMNKDDPHDPGNDEIILSKGHAAPILWAAYAAAGIILKKSLSTLRKIDSDLEGHPTARMPWIKVATGSLGQGLSAGVGMALGMQLLKSPARVYVVLGDGEVAEGMVWEAANMAADKKLNNIVAIVDCNRLGQNAATMHNHDVDAYVKKFEAFGWHAASIDGHKTPEIIAAFRDAKKQSKPCAIIAKTFKGKGISFLENKDGWHGKPLDKTQLQQALDELGAIPDVDSESLVKPPHKVKKLSWKKSSKIPLHTYEKDEAVATRHAYGHALVKCGKNDERIVIVDGDVKNSTGTKNFFKAFPKRSFESYIAEQNMSGVALGLAAKGFIPFTATFAAFLSRAHDVIRMAQYSFSNVKFAGSHAGVSIGPDGPSQMALEDLPIFRAIPGCVILYPSDAISCQRCVHLLLKHKGLGYIRTTRPKTKILYSENDTFVIGGSKTVMKNKNDVVTVVAAGITVHNALAAAQQLKQEGVHIKVIDAYSVQPLDEKTLKKAASKTKVIVVEDHYPAGGLGEAVAALGIPITHLCVRDQPRSGRSDELMAKYGIDKDAIVKAVHNLCS